MYRKFHFHVREALEENEVSYRAFLLLVKLDKELQVLDSCIMRISLRRIAKIDIMLSSLGILGPSL